MKQGPEPWSITIVAHWLYKRTEEIYKSLGRYQKLWLRHHALWKSTRGSPGPQVPEGGPVGVRSTGPRESAENEAPAWNRGRVAAGSSRPNEKSRRGSYQGQTDQSHRKLPASKSSKHERIHLGWVRMQAWLLVPTSLALLQMPGRPCNSAFPISLLCARGEVNVRLTSS